MMINNIGEQAKNMNDRLIAWRRHLHANPELAFETPETAAYIVGELEGMGVTNIRRELAQHGLVALIEGGKPGKVLGMRTDLDALNLAEDTGLPFAATNGWMHACGHDAHMAMSLGAAELIMARRDQLAGAVKLIFQPGEETSLGAPAMIRDGALENPTVDAIVGMHTGGLWGGAEAGEIGYRHGALMASSDFFTVNINGKGGHGGSPHLTVDPIAIGCQIWSTLQTLISREVNPMQPAVVTIGAMHAGTAGNIIAPTCVLQGTLRTMNADVRKTLRRRIEEIVREVAHLMRGSAFAEFVDGPPPVINDRELTDSLRRAATDVLGADHVHEIPEPTTAGEDYAFFTEKIPGTYFFHPSFMKGREYPHHHPKFDIDETVLWVGSATLAQFALTWQQQKA